MNNSNVDEDMNSELIETPQDAGEAGGSRFGRWVAGVLLLGLLGLLGYVLAVGMTADRDERVIGRQAAGRTVEEQFAREDDTVTLLMFEADG